MNSTFIFLKPDALKRGLKEEILKYFTDRDFHIHREKEVAINAPTILSHYQEVIERIGSEDFRQGVLREFVNETIVAIELTHQRADVVAWVRDLIGATDPAKARPDTIRGMYGEDSMEQARLDNRMLRNLIHASDSDENVKQECKLWFE
jgi:nucleoside-diphosphate kinase